MGNKSQKGTVSVEIYRGRIRLRWRYQSKRYSFSLFKHSKENLVHARKTALEIEQDMIIGRFDGTLNKYGRKAEASEQFNKSIISYFEEWTINIMQMDCEKHTNYNSTRNMMRKWGDIQEGNIQKKFSLETNAAVTFNRRLTILKSFCRWLVKKGVWNSNPLEDINPKKVKKVKEQKSKPFTESEIAAILDAFKNDCFVQKSSKIKHSFYHPFVYFIFKTGVRNAEAIGLRVSSIDLENKLITISEVLARSLKGSSASQRIRKETKNGKTRILPLTRDLEIILTPLTEGKDRDELVFKSYKQLSIDDNNFQKRIFKPVLAKLGIEERVLYACRHTFGSRCIDAGMTPVMTSFLMGNNPETALRNYTHQINIPSELPKIH